MHSKSFIFKLIPTMKKNIIILLSCCVSISYGQSIPSLLEGIWVGQGYQLNTNETWSIQLIVEGDSSKIYYSTIPCKSELYIIQKSDNKFIFDEVVTDGICVKNGYVELEIIDLNTIRYKWRFDSGEPGAIAELMKF